MPPQLIHMHTRPSVVPISSQNSDETIFEMFLCNLDSQHTQSCQSHGMQMGRPRDWFELILIAFRFPILHVRDTLFGNCIYHLEEFGTIA